MPRKLTSAGVKTRCLASISWYVENGNHLKAKLAMKAEIRELAREVAHWCLNGESKARLFLRPMEAELVQRYGPHLGRQLYWDFVDVFWLQTWSDSVVFASVRNGVGGFAPEYHAQG